MMTEEAFEKLREHNAAVVQQAKPVPARSRAKEIATQGRLRLIALILDRQRHVEGKSFKGARPSDRGGEDW